jgi:hypothetical protein
VAWCKGRPRHFGGAKLQDHQPDQATTSKSQPSVESSREKFIAASRCHIRASHATPRIALAKTMASVSDNIRASTGVFTTPLQIMSDEPAFLIWLPDEDAFDRPCRILFAIAVISDKASPQSN